MKLTEQFKSRLQKLAGVDSEKKATPKRRGGDFIDYSDSNESDIWYGCSVCDESTAFPGETSCLPLGPFEIDLTSTSNNTYFRIGADGNDTTSPTQYWTGDIYEVIIMKGDMYTDGTYQDIINYLINKYGDNGEGYGP